MNNTNKTSKWKPWHKWVLGIISAFILLGIFAVNTSDKETASNDTVEEKSFVADKPIEAPYLPVTSAAYFNNYQANEVAADEMYKSRNLEVTGTVESINKDFADDIYISLVAGEYETVKCDLSSDNTISPASLKKGQRITLKGRGAGMIIGIPIIENCIIQ